jgi:hypothetical protein
VCFGPRTRSKATNLRLTLPPGKSQLAFSTDAPAQVGLVTFYIVNFDLSDSPKAEQ